MLSSNRDILWRERFVTEQGGTDIWRVGVYANEEMVLYNIFRIEEFADMWAGNLRELYRRECATNIFVKKEKIA